MGPPAAPVGHLLTAGYQLKVKDVGMMAVSVVHKSLNIRKLAHRSRLHAAAFLPPELFQVHIHRGRPIAEL